MAEHYGMGINEGGTFVPKIKYKKHLDMMVIPRPLVKEVDGVVSYVSTRNDVYGYIFLTTRMNVDFLNSKIVKASSQKKWHINNICFNIFFYS